MKPDEKALVALTAFLAGLFAAVVALGAAHWLNRHLWYSDGANLIQWAGGVSTFAAIAMLVYWRWTHRCATLGCVRLGEHPVATTHKKVCRHHHTHHHHSLVALEHQCAEGLLAWGESHLPLPHHHGGPT